jgi:hypothetical protein
MWSLKLLPRRFADCVVAPDKGDVLGLIPRAGTKREIL